MKKVVRFFILVSSLVILSSCTSAENSSMDTATAVKSTLEIVREKASQSSYKLIGFELWESSTTPNEVGYVLSNFVGTDGKVYEQKTFFKESDESHPNPVQKLSITTAYDYDSTIPLDLEKLDVAFIKNYIDEAKKQIPENQKFKSIHQLSMLVRQDKIVQGNELKGEETGTLSGELVVFCIAKDKDIHDNTAETTSLTYRLHADGSLSSL